jgi:hypothetical protein
MNKKIHEFHDDCELIHKNTKKLEYAKLSFICKELRLFN